MFSPVPSLGHCYYFNFMFLFFSDTEGILSLNLNYIKDIVILCQTFLVCKMKGFCVGFVGHMLA